MAVGARRRGAGEAARQLVSRRPSGRKAPPECSSSYGASGGRLQGCPLRGVRPRRWLCGCRARTARGSRRRRFYARASRPASRLVHPTRAHGRDEPDASLVVDHAVRPFGVAFEHRLAHRAQGKACVPLQPVQMPFEGRDRRQVHRGHSPTWSGLDAGATAAPRRGRGQVDRGDGGGEIRGPGPENGHACPRRRGTGVSPAVRGLACSSPANILRSGAGYPGPCPGPFAGEGRDRVSLAPA